MTTQEFEKKLRDALNEQLYWYDFKITLACKDWINNLIQYYEDIFNQISNQTLSKEDALAIIRSDKFDKSDIVWPNSSEAEKITSRAYNEDPNHFIEIINYCGLTNDPADYFYGEWIYNIKPEIIDYVINFIKEL